MKPKKASLSFLKFLPLVTADGMVDMLEYYIMLDSACCMLTACRPDALAECQPDVQKSYATHASGVPA